MTTTDTGVSEELVEWAQRKYLNAPGSGAEAMRLVLEAIAPRLRQEGMRDARAIMLGAMTITEQLRRIDEAIDALSPQVKETKLVERCSHEGYSFKQHGRCCHKCGTFMVDFGD